MKPCTINVTKNKTNHYELVSNKCKKKKKKGKNKEKGGDLILISLD